MLDDQTASIERCLGRLNEGDEAARRELLELAQDRLTRLTRSMLGQFPGVRRWEQTDDVWQNASLRLWRSLERVVPESPLHFYRLAAMQIRRELIELARHYYGPLGHGGRHETHAEGDSPAQASAGQADRREGQDLTHEATHVARWTEFHEFIERLPNEEREVFDLIWYQGLKQSDAAELLDVNIRTVKRRWQSARLALAEAIGFRPE